eukprot:Rhum_TRINITY_DN18882_c0_g1::Rhum_TRINITY_DN18882_c0_g1_i1::g.168662::m.168662
MILQAARLCGAAPMLSRRWPRRACAALPTQQRRWKQERTSLAGLGLKSPTEVGMSPKVNASQGSQSVMEHLQWAKHESAKEKEEREEKQEMLRQMDASRQPSFYQPQDVDGEDGEEVPESLFLINTFAILLGWVTSLFSMFWLFFSVTDFAKRNLGIYVPPFGYGRSNQSTDAFSVSTSWLPMMVLPSMVAAVLSRDIFTRVLLRQSDGLAKAYHAMVSNRVQGTQLGSRENHESGINKLFSKPNNPHHDHRGLDLTHVAGIKNILTIEERDNRRGRR